VGYDWRGYYPKTLVSKFAWAEKNNCPTTHSHRTGILI
jgi:hypothetical protein